MTRVGDFATAFAAALLPFSHCLLDFNTLLT